MEKKIQMRKEPNVKLAYFPPEISCIELDNQISLALESPPAGPGELSKINTDSDTNAPYFTV